METKYIAILIVIILAINRFRLSKRIATRKEKNKGEISYHWTYSILFLLYLGVFLGSIFENYFFVSKLNIIIFMVGFLAYWIALIGRNKTMKTLGRYWSTHIEIRDDQHIVREGPYKYVRHPGYLSLVIENLSLPVMLNAYYFLLVVICIYIPVIFVVAKLEDREMEKKIGNAFSEYKAKTGAFLPKKIGTFIIPFKKKHLPKNS